MYTKHYTRTMGNNILISIYRLFVTSLDTAAYSVVYYAVYNSSTPDTSSLLFDWFLVFLLADLGYYWFHRAAHGKYTEPNIVRSEVGGE